MPLNIHPIPFKVGTFIMGTSTGFNGDAFFPVSLKELPRFMQSKGRPMVGHVVEFMAKFTVTVATLASDPAIKSYMLHSLIDWQLIGPGSADPIIDRPGWQDPLRLALQTGRVRGLRAADIPATGGGGPGSYTRTFTKHMYFVEDQLSGLAALSRCMPAIAYAKTNSKLQFKVYKSAPPGTLNGATPTITACQIDLYAMILDLPAERTIVPAFVHETTQPGKTELHPTPGNGKFLRVSLANAPWFPSSGDELAPYTKINYFGTNNNWSVYDEDVDERMRRYAKEIIDPVEPHNTVDAPATNATHQKEEFRFLDPTENLSGKLHAIPLVYPQLGQDLPDMREWYGNEPTLKANDDSRAGLPASVDFVVDRIETREAPALTAILNALGDKARNAFVQKGGAAAHIFPGYRSRGDAAQLDVSRLPLMVDGTEG